MPQATVQRTTLSQLRAQLEAGDGRQLAYLTFDPDEFREADAVAYCRQNGLLGEHDEPDIRENDDAEIVVRLMPFGERWVTQFDHFEIEPHGETAPVAIRAAVALPREPALPSQDDLHEQPVLYRATAQIVETRARGSAEVETLMGLLRDRVLDPKVFDEAEPFFFRVQASNGLLDSYGTRMMDDTLRNFAADAQAGVALLDSHVYQALPLGGTLRGTFKKGRGGDPSRTWADIFIWPGQDNGRMATDVVIDGIRKGTYRDTSVGFYGGVVMCSICEIDMFDWRGLWDDDVPWCPHMPGNTYDVDGKQVVAEGHIFGSNLAEISLVYDGATPQSMAEKIFRMQEAGRLPASAARQLAERYRMRAPDVARRFAGFKIDQSAPTEREPSVSANAKPPIAATTAPTPERLTELEQRIAELEAQAATDRASLASTHAERQRIFTLLNAPENATVDWAVDSITTLMARAKDGATHRNQLIEDTLKEGVRAYGNAWDQARYRAVLEATPDLDTIKIMQEDFKRVAKVTVPDGRQTEDGADEVKTPTPLDPSVRRRVGRVFSV